MQFHVAGFRRISLFLTLVPLVWLAQGCSDDTGKKPHAGAGPKAVSILNVSYDPTRELYKDFNEVFAAHWLKETGQKVSITPSHDGSGKQARSVIGGNEADVVTLALANDIDNIVKKSDGLIAKDWQSRLPNNSAPYTSTIIFLVRKGNPKGIKDWNDLLKPDVEIITPDPATSGGACWNYLAAWGFVLKRELGDLAKLHDPKQADAVAKAQEKAFAFVKEMFGHVKVLDSGARSATLTFVKKRRGDVLLAWENEAIFSVKDMKKGEYEIVVPSISIRAEPSVAVVDKIVDKHGTRKVAEAYLKYLYSPEGQRIAAKHYYRPRVVEGIPEEYMKNFAKVELFEIGDVFGGWAKAYREHFGKGGLYEKMSKAKR
ncbi:MAG: sulfate ABC transporter substrate-binding protein [Planctomycetaceae bacterium]|nr:sulfate ABC transporter substrate-binding protein [Planctomycetaceae bacterium]